MWCLSMIALLAAWPPPAWPRVPDDGLERLTELIKEPGDGQVVEYLPGEPIVVYYRVKNASSAPLEVDAEHLGAREFIYVRLAGDRDLRPDEAGEEEPEDPGPPRMVTLKPGYLREGYWDLTILYTSSLPEAGGLDIFLPWPIPGRVQSIRIAPPRGPRRRWHGDYLTLQQMKRWIHFFGNEPEEGTRVELAEGLELLEGIATRGGHLREWAMYYKGWFIGRVLQGEVELDEWKPLVTEAFGEFLEEYPGSHVAPAARYQMVLWGGKPLEPRSGTEAEPSPGEAEAADTGSDAAAARPTEEEGVVTASGNGLEQHGARQRLLIVGVLAAVLAVALGGVLAVRRRSRG